MQKMKPFFYSTLLLLISALTACRGQVNESKKCEESLRNAKVNLKDYYQSNSDSFLRKSLSYVNHAIRCNQTRHKSIDLKISVLTLLKEYKIGYEFADSLNETDFELPYKKNMTSNFFRGLEYETKGDTVERNKNFGSIITEIQNYINKNSDPSSEKNKKAYYDFFLIKKTVFGLNQVNIEIDKLKSKYPYGATFFENIKESLNENSVEVSPMKELDK